MWGDPCAVELEHQIEKGHTGSVFKKADYVLIHESMPFAVVEAKRLGRPLDDEVTSQASTYANIKDIPWVVVTDGDHWRMHEVFKRGPIEDRTHDAVSNLTGFCKQMCARVARVVAAEHLR